MCATRREIVHTGDMDALRDFIEENRATLEARAKWIRADAAEAQRRLEDRPTVPITNRHWVKWLEANQEKFREVLKSASARRSILREIGPSGTRTSLRCSGSSP